ncbi:MAG: DUF4249 domain-containing protein [Paludibacter sp.]|nr:DUF4249 domain-containing protein [Paludibacter sp.]
MKRAWFSKNINTYEHCHAKLIPTYRNSIQPFKNNFVRMNIKTYISLLFFTVLFVSCERDIEFNGEITNPLVAVNSFVTPDSTVSAYISLSRFFLQDSIDFQSIKNADVNLWVNGVLKEKLTSGNNGIYKGTYKPTAADQIKLTVNVPQMQQVSATTSFTQAPVVLSIDTQKVVLSKEVLFWNLNSTDTLCVKYKYKVNYKLTFKDNADLKNYYRLIVKYISYEGVWNNNTNKVDTIIDERTTQYSAFDFTDVVSGNTKDPLSDEGTSPVGTLLSNVENKYHVFSDDIFNGKTYVLEFSTGVTRNVRDINYGTLTDVKHKVYINLQSISKDYYLYLKTRAASSASNFFSEPVKVHNNIDGGVGILGSYTSSNIVEFDLP